MSDPHPFMFRHVLREARRGKCPLVAPDVHPSVALPLATIVEGAIASGFVQVRHIYRCPIGRASSQVVQAPRLDAGCRCGMELTKEGIRELALLEAEIRANTFLGFWQIHAGRPPLRESQEAPGP